MRNKKGIFCVIIALLLGILGSCASADQSTSIGYAVRPVLPDNQIDDSIRSFDLKIAPGQQQTLEVIVLNRGDEEIQVAVEANTAFSNSNGAIEFAHSEDRDPSMVVDFVDIVTPVEDVVSVSPNGQAVAEFLIDAPEEPFEGVVYGGFMFTMLDQGEDEEEGAEGVAIRSVYRYAVGVRLRQSEAAVEPAFELLGASIDETILPALQIQLRNPVAVIARDITLRVNAYLQDGDELVFAVERNGIAMAPNSSMDYTIYFNNDNSLDAGEYRVSVELEFEDQSWEFETPLIVG